MAQKRKVKLRATVEAIGDPVWHVVRVPRSKVEHFGFKGNLRRVLCSLNGIGPFNYALMPSRGDYFITLSKQRRKDLKLNIGDAVIVEIEKDESKYGMPLPEEFAEVLRQDPDGERLFDSISPGNQRLMLKLVVAVSDVDKRIIRSLTGIELLKKSDGRFDWHEQNRAMRAATSRDPNLDFEPE